MLRSLIAVGLLAATPASAEFITRTVEGDFDDIAFAVESAIVGKGLVIDSVSHVGDMLERTKADVGGTRTLYTQADVFSFCSASISRKVMEADPANIQFCPYGIAVYALPDQPGQVTVGYRSYPDGAMQEVQQMLGAIVAEALD
ncbi:DUF302 domain-containing protein [Gemmobacter sp.]|uniref:DUF302 domain-containing protein n=1 Tax=Gemmobacter sp. TaxID=1898957 RepID=UPI002AFFC2ED|nr:DUF302 domain-containing protein [Gemmobacter sp.]